VNEHRKGEGIKKANAWAGTNARHPENRYGTSTYALR